MTRPGRGDLNDDVVIRPQPELDEVTAPIASVLRGIADTKVRGRRRVAEVVAAFSAQPLSWEHEGWSFALDAEPRVLIAPHDIERAAAVFDLTVRDGGNNVIFRDRVQAWDGTPVLVPDGTKNDRETSRDNFREDPILAARIDLAHTVHAVTKGGKSPWVKAKPGTVSTFYSGAADGTVDSSNATYATARAGSALSASTTGPSEFAPAWNDGGGGGYQIRVAFMGFDTSALGTDIVSSAVLSWYITGVDNTNNWGSINARLYDWGATLTTADWRPLDGTSAGDTLLATLARTAISTSAYNDFADVALPANVNLSGTTRLYGVISNAESATPPSGGDNRLAQLSFSEASGTTQDPKLVVTHVPSVSRTLSAFRFRNDDGNEAAATWPVAENAALLREAGVTTRLRVQSDIDGDPATEGMLLQYRPFGDTDWRDVASDDSFPSVGSSNTTAGTSLSGGVALNMPASIEAGDLLLAFTTNDAPGATDMAISGWQQIFQAAYTSNVVKHACFAKLAVGSDTATLTGASQDFSAVTVRIPKGQHGVTNVATDIPAGTAALTSGSAPNPPNLSPGSTRKWLWIESFGADDDDDTATYWTTGYTGIAQIESASSTSSCLTAVAYLQSEASSLNPGAMAMAASEEALANVIAIPPYAEGITLSASANIGASGANTTAQLTAPAGKTTGDFGGGRIQDDENPTDDVDVGADEYREDEWSLIATAAAVVGSRFEFRLVLDDGSPFDAYDETPEWLIPIEAEPPVGTVAITGHAPDVVPAQVVVADSGDVAITGHAPTVSTIYMQPHPSPFGAVRVDVYAGDGTTKLGAGPLSALMQCSYSEAVDEMGAFNFACPGDHPAAAHIDDLRYVRIFVGGEGYVFQGQITGFETEVTAEGRRRMTVQGWSSVFELTRKKTGYGFQVIDETMADAVDLLLAGTGWTRGTVDAAVVESYELEFNGVTRLEALRKLAEVQGFILRFDSRTRVVDMGAMGLNPNGLRFTGMEGPVSPRFMADVRTVVPIGDIKVVSESNDVRNKVRIIGQMEGIDGDVLTLANSDIDTPYTRQSEVQGDGRTVYFLKDAASDTAHGEFEEDLQVSEIRILGTTDAHRLSAANALYGVAATFLARHKDPLKNYALSPVGLRHIAAGSDLFDVGDKYPVWFRGWRQEAEGRRVWVEVDAELWLMARERTIDASGRRTWQLGFSTTTREIPTESAAVAEVLNNVKSSLAARLPILTWGGVVPVGRLTQEGGQLAGPKTDVFQAEVPNRSWSWFRDDFEGVKIGDIAGQWDDSFSFDTNSMLVRARKGTNGGGASIGVWNSDDPEDYDAMFNALYEHVGDVFRWLTATAPLGAMVLEKIDDDNWTLKILRGGALVKVGGMELVIMTVDHPVIGTTLETAVSIPIAANQKIQFEGTLYESGDPWRLSVEGPSGAVGRFGAERPGTSFTPGMVGDNAELGSTLTGLGDGIRHIHGAVVNGSTAGNILIRFAESSAVGDATLQAGSFVKYQVQ